MPARASWRPSATTVARAHPWPERGVLRDDAGGWSTVVEVPATNGEAEQGASTAEDLGSARTIAADAMPGA
jgi:hypothetical protein